MESGNNIQPIGLDWLTTEDKPQLRSDGDKQYIEGYAVLFYDPKNPGSEYNMGGDCFERVSKNAFDDVLLSGENVESWVDHSKDWYLGSTQDNTLSLRKDDKGIFYSIRVDPTFVDHVKAVQYGQRQRFKGSSFQASWQSSPSREGKKFIRTINKIIALRELGPCYRPAYKGTNAQLALRNEVEEQTKVEQTRLKIEKWKAK